MFQGVDVNGRETFIHHLIISKLGQHHVKCPLTFSKRCVSLVALLQHPHKIYPFMNVIYICYTKLHGIQCC
jgi:hypothetical protein